jgi:hypothetical protein
MVRSTIFAAAAALLATASPALAQNTEVWPDHEFGKWWVYGDDDCWITWGQLDDEDGPELVMSIGAEEDELYIGVQDDSWSWVEKGKDIAARLRFGSQDLTLSFNPMAVGPGYTGFIPGSPEAALRAMSRADSIRVTVRPQTVVELPLSDAREAFADMLACTKKLRPNGVAVK